MAGIDDNMIHYSHSEKIFESFQGRKKLNYSTVAIILKGQPKLLITVSSLLKHSLALSRHHLKQKISNYSL